MINKEPKHNTDRTDTETQKVGPKHAKPASNDGTPTGHRQATGHQRKERRTRLKHRKTNTATQKDRTEVNHTETHKT